MIMKFRLVVYFVVFIIEARAITDTIITCSKDTTVAVEFDIDSTYTLENFIVGDCELTTSNVVMVPSTKTGFSTWKLNFKANACGEGSDKEISDIASMSSSNDITFQRFVKDTKIVLGNYKIKTQCVFEETVVLSLDLDIIKPESTEVSLTGGNTYQLKSYMDKDRTTESTEITSGSVSYLRITETTNTGLYYVPTKCYVTEHAGDGEASDFKARLFDHDENKCYKDDKLSVKIDYNKKGELSIWDFEYVVFQTAKGGNSQRIVITCELTVCVDEYGKCGKQALSCLPAENNWPIEKCPVGQFTDGTKKCEDFACNVVKCSECSGNEVCSTCDNYYYLTTEGRCEINVCTCDDGTVAEDCTENGKVQCGSCDDTTTHYLTDSKTCEKNKCECTGGKPVEVCAKHGNKQCASCNDGYYFFELEKICIGNEAADIHISEETMTRDDAKRYCENRGSEMILARESVLNDRVKKSLNDISVLTYGWIGADWASTDKYHDFNKNEIAYHPWCAGQPDNPNGSELCLHYFTSLKCWNDVGCWAKYNAICIKPPSDT